MGSRDTFSFVTDEAKGRFSNATVCSFLFVCLFVVVVFPIQRYKTIL